MPFSAPPDMWRRKRQHSLSAPQSAERVRAAVRCTHISAQRWPALPSSQPEIDDVEICEHMLRASVSKFISMLNYPRGAELPGNCRLPLLVLSSWILVLRRGWSYRLMFQLFHFAHLQLWLCFSNSTPVHTWPQYRQGVSTNAARVDVWAFPLGAKLFIHASIHFLHPLSPALRALLPQGQGQGFTPDLL